MVPRDSSARMASREAAWERCMYRCVVSSDCLARRGGRRTPNSSPRRSIGSKIVPRETELGG
jgi:hypothetical protein